MQSDINVYNTPLWKQQAIIEQKRSDLIDKNKYDTYNIEYRHTSLLQHMPIYNIGTTCLHSLDLKSFKQKKKLLKFFMHSSFEGNMF